MKTCKLVIGYKLPVASYRLQVTSGGFKVSVMNSYRDLDIYKESKRLAIEVHRLSLTLPKFEMYEEGSQVRRSSKSVTSAIVEGYARRRYKADFIKYLVYAQAECDETIIHLDFLFEAKSLLDKSEYDRLNNEYNYLSRRINNFIKWVETSLNEFNTIEVKQQVTGNR